MEPGKYSDGRGNKRYWDGHRWTEYVDDGSGGWRTDRDIPPDLPPGAFDRDRMISPPPGHGGSGGAGAAMASGGGSILLGGAFLALIIFYLVGELVKEMRWLLLIGWLVLTGVGVARLLSGKRPATGLFRGVGIWLLVGIGAWWGFDKHHEDTKPKPPWQVYEAHELLKGLVDLRLHHCDGFPEDEERKLAARYGVSDCREAVKKVVDQIDGEDREKVRNGEITITYVGTRKVPNEPYEPRRFHRVRLGENPFGWRELEFEGGFQWVPELRSISW